MNILGISSFYHDSAAALVAGGEIISAAMEERFTRVKHDSSFPRRSIQFCLDSAGLKIGDLDVVVFYEKPFLKFERILETYLAYAPYGIRSFLLAAPEWIKKKIWIKDIIAEELKYKGKILFCGHHESHAASAFYPSPFERAAFLTTDGTGEWSTTSWGTGQGNKMKTAAVINFPHSLGLLYSAFTYYTGFRVNSGEYKLMGLAPYGEPVYKDVILSNLIDVKEDGSFRLNMKYFNYCSGLTMTGPEFHKLFGGLPRKPDTSPAKKDMDLARSIQEVTEEVMLRMAAHIKRESSEENLCLAGGVALNCVANGRLYRNGLFKNIWIQPAAGDAGGALGAALAVWYNYSGNKREPGRNVDFMKGALLGPEYQNNEIELFLQNSSIPFELISTEEIPGKIAGFLASGAVVGWFQGKMEFGPRALGSRSILGDPRQPDMQKKMNLKIKFRESFRPFAPSVTLEDAALYFDIDIESPYMLLTVPVNAEKRKAPRREASGLRGLDLLNEIRSQIPAVTHVDYSARVQTVRRESNPLFHRLLETFRDKHGCPVLVNTSFNVRGEPIVCSPEDAYRCFSATSIDYLIMGNFLIDKKNIPSDSGFKYAEGDLIPD